MGLRRFQQQGSALKVGVFVRAVASAETFAGYGTWRGARRYTLI